MGGVSDNESQSLLSVLEWLLADSAFKEDPGSLPAKMFEKYLKELVRATCIYMYMYMCMHHVQ